MPRTRISSNRKKLLSRINSLVRRTRKSSAGKSIMKAKRKARK